jgi:hypothetical protein
VILLSTISFGFTAGTLAGISLTSGSGTKFQKARQLPDCCQAISQAASLLMDISLVNWLNRWRTCRLWWRQRAFFLSNKGCSQVIICPAIR